MKYLALAALFVVSACAQAPTRSVSVVQQECGAGTKPFTETWPCVRSGMAGVRIDEDLKAVYLATGDYIAEQVRAGKMTEAEAALAIAEARRRGYDAALARQPVPPPLIMGAVDFQRVAQPMDYSTTRGTVICQRAGPSSVFCN